MIRRSIFNDLRSHLNQKEITMITGPRQSGKTTLMKLLESGLAKRGQKTIFLNLDIEADKYYFKSQSRLIDKIRLEIGSEPGFVFIDEIQRKENAGIFLKGIYDMELPYKFIVSGSGSIELKEKIKESLTGRKREFQLTTLTFAEFFNYKTGYKYEDKLETFFALENEATFDYLREYLNFGGYPRVVLAETVKEKRLIISEIYQSYIERDIANLLGIKKTEAFSSLVRLLASQIGGLINISQLAATLGIAQKTLRDYFWYLEKTFIISRCLPFFTNPKKEITKSPIAYFQDLGLRNYSLGIFGNADLIERTGFIFQNFIYNLLSEKMTADPGRVNFWRTKDGAEVDFVINLGKNRLPFEVKYTKMTRPIVNRSLKNFIRRFQPKSAFLINLSLKHELNLNGATVRFMPFYELINYRIEID